MPGVYRKKNCPQCGVEHRKRGNFCSVACSNSHRTISDKTKLLHQYNSREWKKSPEGIATTKKFARDIEKHKRRQSGEYVPDEDDWYILPEHDEVDTNDEGWEEVDDRW